MLAKLMIMGLILVLMTAAVAGGATLASGGEAGSGENDSEEVVVEDENVSVESIQNTEVEAGEQDELAVRIAEILGADLQATAQAMAQTDGLPDTALVQPRELSEEERNSDSQSVEAKGLSYQEYGERIGAILGADGEKVARAIAQAYQGLYAVEREIWENGSGRDMEERKDSDKL